MAVKEKDKKKAEKDDAEEKEGPETKDQAEDNGEGAEESEGKDKERPSPARPWAARSSGSPCSRSWPRS